MNNDFIENKCLFGIGRPSCIYFEHASKINCIRINPLWIINYYDNVNIAITD